MAGNHERIQKVNLELCSICLYICKMEHTIISDVVEYSTEHYRQAEDGDLFVGNIVEIWGYSLKYKTTGWAQLKLNEKYVYWVKNYKNGYRYARIKK